MFRNMTSEPVPRARRQPDPGAAAKRRRKASADSPGSAHASADTLAALEAGLAGELAAAQERRAQRSPADREQLTLSDPKAMRALAHPLRMALLELLEAAGTLTATQAGEQLGESPANCAFHLRTLAKYGFVREAGGGRGRERPWELAHVGIQLESDQEDPRASATAGMLQRMWLNRVLERARNALSSPDPLPDAWKHTQEAAQRIQFLTPDEMTELTGEVLGILGRYKDQRTDPSRRPDGALPVELLFFGYPLIDLAGLAENVRPPRHNDQTDRGGARPES